MIAARGKERGAAALAGRVQADGAAIEAVRLFEVADAKVHMADAQIVGSLGVVGGIRIRQRQQAVDVELVGRHRDRAAVPFPGIGGAIGIDFDTVAFGIVEIDGFADEVIGEAGQRDLVGGGVHQPAREVFSRRHQERGVIQPRRIARLARRGLRRCRFNSLTPPEPSSAPIIERAMTVSPIASR